MIHLLLDEVSERIDAASALAKFAGTVLVTPGPQKIHNKVINGTHRLVTFLLLCAQRRRFSGRNGTKH